MSISTLNIIKAIEAKIASLTAATIKSVREEIDALGESYSTVIADQLRAALWSAARASELI